MQVADSDTRSKNSIIRVGCCLVSGSFSSQVVKLYGGNTLVDAVNDLAGDFDGVYIVLVETVAELGDTSCDLVDFTTSLRPSAE